MASGQLSAGWPKEPPAQRGRDRSFELPLPDSLRFAPDERVVTQGETTRLLIRQQGAMVRALVPGPSQPDALSPPTESMS